MTFFPIIAILPRRSRADFSVRSVFPPFFRRVILTFFHFPPILTFQFGIYRRDALKNASGAFGEIGLVVYNRSAAKRPERRNASRSPSDAPPSLPVLFIRSVIFLVWSKRLVFAVHFTATFPRPSRFGERYVRALPINLSSLQPLNPDRNVASRPGAPLRVRRDAPRSDDA